MKDLFYTESDKRLFWVSGYSNNSETIGSIKQRATAFAKIAKIAVEDVQTYVIQNSRRYRYMRVYYCTSEFIPTEIDHKFGSDWTMFKYLED